MFTFVCVSTTFSMVVYWAYKFNLDENISVITYRKFYEREDDVYPTISMCLINPFLKQRLADYRVNQSSYLEYLKGEYFSEDMLKVNYNNVTIDIKDSIKGYKMYFRNGSDFEVKFEPETNVKEKQKLAHVSYNGFYWSWGFKKCFSLDIPRIQGLQIFRILLSNNIYQTTHGKRPTYIGFTAVYHMPHQFLLSQENMKWTWPYRGVHESYKTRFLIGDVTIMKSRNKHHHRCIEACVDYDNWVMELHKNETKCNIPYLKVDEKLPMCRSKTLIKRGLVEKYIAFRKDLLQPCRKMENIDVQNLETTTTPSDDATIKEHVGEFWFSVNFKNPTFKEIEQKRYSIRFP